MLLYGLDVVCRSLAHSLYVYTLATCMHIAPQLGFGRGVDGHSDSMFEMFMFFVCKCRTDSFLFLVDT